MAPPNPKPKLTANLLLNAYAGGIFPMAETRDDLEVFWVDPRRRGVFPLDGFHISRSLARALRRDDYTVTLNQGFRDTVLACADRDETWISDQIFTLYLELHDAGFAHSVEVRDLDGILIGGVFGITIGAAFFGESMFSARRNASKVALAYLLDMLKTQGFTLFDTQFITPHLASLGAVEISRATYRARLKNAVSEPLCDLKNSVVPTPYEVLQRKGQTS